MAFGAVGIALGFDRADPIIGLIISIAIFAVLRSAAKQVYERLMDAVDPSLVDEIEHQAGHVVGVTDVSDVRVRWIGHRLGAEMTIEIASEQKAVEGHRVAVMVQRRLQSTIAHLDNATVHIHAADHRHHEPLEATSPLD